MVPARRMPRVRDSCCRHTTNPRTYTNTPTHRASEPWTLYRGQKWHIQEYRNEASIGYMGLATHLANLEPISIVDIAMD